MQTNNIAILSNIFTSAKILIIMVANETEDWCIRENVSDTSFLLSQVDAGKKRKETGASYYMC